MAGSTNGVEERALLGCGALEMSRFAALARDGVQIEWHFGGWGYCE
jgi:hypothetical protein